MNKFSAIAKRETSLSDVMTGRNKISTEDVIRRFPDGVTVTEFDNITIFDGKKGEDVTFPVFAIKEDPEVCFFGGAVLTRIANEWIKGYDGDYQKASEDLEAGGGVKIKMSHKRTKNGNNVTAVEVIE